MEAQKLAFLEQLREFLADAKVSKDEPFTHTTKSTGSLQDGWPSGSYYIDANHLDDFFTRYCNAVRYGIYPTITERPGPYGPLRVDFDFKSSLDNGTKRMYTTNTLQHIVRLYQEEIRNIIDPDEFQEKLLWCIVLEKSSPRLEDGKVKDGFHLHFPHFICEGWIQDEYLRDKVSVRMIEEKVWEGKKFLTPVEDMIDKNIFRKPWMMYGSMNYKNKKSMPYLYDRWPKTLESKRYGHVFDENQKEIHLEEIFEDEMIGFDKTVRYYLPRLLSIRGYTQPISIKDEIIQSKPSSHKKKKKRQIARKRRMEDIMADIKLIKDGDIMSMLSDDRAEDYNSWMDVGWTLFNIGQGCDDALDLWIEFSQRSGKYVEGECENIWGTMELRDKTIASLLAMARVDSPDAYNAWKDTNVRFFLWKSLFESKPNEYDVSMVVAKMFGDKFICADAKHDVWYYFEDHRWRQMDCGIQLRKLFVGEVLVKYCDILRELSDQIKELECKLGVTIDKDSPEMREMVLEHKDLCEKKKRCRAVMTALKTTSFHKKLLEMCQLEMHDALFHRKMNENKMILTCENGVLDLENCIFREGRPDDYSTFSTGRHYRVFREDDEEVKELEEYLLKVYPNKHRRDYFIDFFASILRGGNRNKDWLVATGPSDGAKSMTFRMLEYVFGSGKTGYFGKFPRESFVQATGKNSSSGPRPELARVRGKRVMGGQEVTKQEKINIGFAKEVTGNDSIWARGMWEKDADEIVPQFCLVIQCNDPPEIPGHDEAMWRRISVVDHESKFVTADNLKKFPVPSTLEEQLKVKRFHADPDFGDCIPDLADVLLWKLFERYKVMTRDKIKLRKPKEVLLSTEMYQANNDVYLRFIADRLEREVDEEKIKTTYIKHVELYSEFKEWYSDEYPSYARERIGKSKLKAEMSKRMGVIHNEETDQYGFGKLSRWWGWKFIQEDDGEEESFDDLLGKEEK